MAHGCSYFKPDYVPLSEYIPPLRVCIDNETCDNCTLVKVDGANRHGILLKIVQILSDLDLIISKSYISSDNGWFMNSFYITDHNSQKLRNPTLINYIEQSLNVAQNQNESNGPNQVKISNGNIVRADHFTSNCVALEILFLDRPGIFSEIITALINLSCVISSGAMWTHNGHVACILDLKEQGGQPIPNRARVVCLGEYVARVVGAHYFSSELWGVQLRIYNACRIHTERRLHQLMQVCKDFEVRPPPLSFKEDQFSMDKIKDAKKRFGGVEKCKTAMCQPQVSIENWKERNYLVVNIRSRDRPKLMFDIMCVLTDLEYDILHGSISSHGSEAVQEYFVRRTNGCTVLNEMEKESIVRSLAAAINRRMVPGLKMEMHTADRHNLLSDVGKALRENSLSLKRAEFAKEDGLAIGAFYINDASSYADANYIDQQRLEAVCTEIGGGVFFEKKNDRSISSPTKGIWSLFSRFYSLGRSVWSHIKHCLRNFSFIR